MNNDIEHRKYMLPNIFTHIDHSKDKLTRIEVPLKLQEVVCKLAIKFPDFTFSSSPSVYAEEATDAAVPFTHYGICDVFKVTSAERDTLGTLTWDDCKEVICIESVRVKDMRKYKRNIQTKDVKRAVAIASKAFKPPAVDEMLTQTAESAGRSLWGVQHAAVSAFENLYRAEFFNRKHVVMDNFEAVLDLLGVDLKTGEITKLPELHEKSTLLYEMHTLYKAGKGHVVKIKDKRYLIAGASGDNPTYFTQDKVDNHIRKCIGMLKLVKDNAAISNIGLRISEFEFYIVPSMEVEK